MITIDRGVWGKKDFADVAAFRLWLVKEQTDYQQLVPWMPNHGNVFQYFQHSLNYIDQYLSSGNSQSELLAQAINHANQLYGPQGYSLPPFDSLDGKFIQSASSDVRMRGRIAAQIGNPSPSVNEDTIAALMVAAYKYPKLVGTKGFSFAESTAEIVRDAKAELSTLRMERAAFEVERRKLFDNFGTDQTSLHADLAKLAEDQRNHFDSQWTTLNEKYDSKLSLQAPRRYWERQLESHTKAAGAARRRFVGVSAVTASIVALLIARLWYLTGGFTPSDIPIGMWVITGALLGLGFWVVRLFSRLYLSREHLARDAEERVTMIETYLSLLERDNVSKDELKFVLAAIFRPTEDGLVRDDGLPAPLLELFQSAKPR